MDHASINRLDAPPVLGEPVSGALIDGSITFSIDLVSMAEMAITLPTPAGESPIIYLIRHKGVPFWYVHFHGVNFLSAKDNVDIGFTRVWYSLHRLEVRDVISGAAAGSIHPEMRPGDVVVMTDFIDLSNHRPRSMITEIWSQAPYVGASFVPALCPELSDILRQACSIYTLGKVFPSGVLAQFEGHRFESPAEIKMARTLGGDMVAHHQASEAIYARELGIHFGALNYVSNIAAGLAPDWEASFVTEDQAKAGYQLCSEVMLDTMAAAGKRECHCAYCPQPDEQPVSIETIEARPVFR